MSELREPVPKYVQIMREAIERAFVKDGELVHSISWLDFKQMCDERQIKDENGRHQTTLQYLDNLGIVVAPDCYGDAVPAGMRVLNPEFVKRVLFVQLLMQHPRPKDGVVRLANYRSITAKLNPADVVVLEELMETCLIAFRVMERGQPLGWFVPDLLDPAQQLPEWTSALWSTRLKAERFLNESHFFEFLAEQFRLQQVEATIVRGEPSWSINRDVVVLSRPPMRARVTFDARGRTVGIEVRGGKPESARTWCNDLARDWEQRLGMKANPLQDHKIRKIGAPPKLSTTEKEQLRAAGAKALKNSESPTGFANAYYRREPTDQELVEVQKLWQGFRAK